MPPDLKPARIRARGATEGKDHVQYLLRLCELELPGGVRRQIFSAAPLARGGNAG